MEHNARAKLNRQICEEACEWFVECRAGDLDAAARREFDRWLRKSPEHLSAYLEIAAIWNEGPSLDPEHKWDTDTLIVQAAEDLENVIPFARATIGDSRQQKEGKTPAMQGEAVVSQSIAVVKAGEESSGRNRRLFTMAASIAVISCAASILVWSQLFRLPTYTTAIGERRSIMLADGSTVELNSRSKIKVGYSEKERAVELLRGQALFHVAKEHARPFIVTSDEMQVRAVGTQFDVYKKRSGTIVTVVEGRVAIVTRSEVADFGSTAVDPYRAPSMPLPAGESKAADFSGATAGAGILLSAGEQLTVTVDAVQKTDRPNIAGATAWTQRQLVFESASLADVAEEFNRHNERQLVIEDAQLYDFHISGVFSSTDPSSLIRFLRERPGVQVIETTSEIRVATKTP